MANLGSMVATLTMKTAPWSKGISTATAQLTGFSGVVEGIGTRLAHRMRLLGAVGIGAISAGIGYSIRAAAKQEEADAALAESLRGIGKYSPEAMAGLKKLALQIQRTTRYTDDDVEATMKMLVTLGKLGPGGPLEKATEMTLGLAEHMGGDTTRAARLVIMAMHGQFTAFSRYGVSLKDAKTNAEKWVAVQDLARRGMELQAAKTHTGIGAFQQLAKEIGETAESLGGPFLRALKPVVEQSRAYLAAHQDLVQAKIEDWANTIAASVPKALAVVRDAYAWLANAADLARFAWNQTQSLVEEGLRRVLEVHAKLSGMLPRGVRPEETTAQTQARLRQEIADWTYEVGVRKRIAEEHRRYDRQKDLEHDMQVARYGVGFKWAPKNLSYWASGEESKLAWAEKQLAIRKQQLYGPSAAPIPQANVRVIASESTLAAVLRTLELIAQKLPGGIPARAGE